MDKLTMLSAGLTVGGSPRRSADSGDESVADAGTIGGFCLKCYKNMTTFCNAA